MATTTYTTTVRHLPPQPTTMTATPSTGVFLFPFISTTSHASVDHLEPDGIVRKKLVYEDRLEPKGINYKRWIKSTKPYPFFFYQHPTFIHIIQPLSHLHPSW